MLRQCAQYDALDNERFMMGYGGNAALGLAFGVLGYGSARIGIGISAQTVANEFDGY